MSTQTVSLAPAAVHSAEASSPSSSDTLEEFVRAGWHTEVEKRLTFRYGRSCGSAAIDEALGHALERAATQLEARHGRQVYAFVLTAAEHWLLDSFKGARRAQARGWARRIDPAHVEERDELVELSAEELWIQRDGDAIRDEIVNELLHRLETGERVGALSERARLVMTLFHGEHLTKREIRARTGLTPKQLRTALTDGNKFLHDEYLAAESRFDSGDCGQGAAAVTRLVFDVARGHDAKRARAHARHCLSCARRAQRAEAARHALGLLLPFPPLAVEGSVPRGSLLEPVVALASRVKTALGKGVADRAESVQAAAASGAGRGAASPAAALAAKLAAACLATGGIAATCAGTGLLGSPSPHHHRSAKPARSVPARSARPRVASAATPTRLNVSTQRLRSASGTSTRRSDKRHKRPAANPEEFFTPSPQPSNSSSVPSPTTRAPTATQSAKPEPTEFPIF
jgi:hypothetical protein